MKDRHLIHLHWRSGFGITPSSLKSAKLLNKTMNVNSIFEISKQIEPIQLDLSEFDKFLKTPYKKYKEIHGDEAATKLRQKSQRMVRQLNFEWLKKIASSECVLREKMTLFWANVFVCRDNHILHAIQFNNTLRTHALGDFGAFVKAVARTPSMLKYLNNNRNVKLKPNENFARELLELFTLGLGNYSEQDIKEAARAFTGWNFKANGDFILRANKHDENSKTFLGVTGNLDGDDVVDIILKQRQCAEFICRKIYTYFVNPNIDASHLDELTDLFYKDYDIEKLMRYLFMSDWFYNENNIGAKIKSPVELMVGIHKIVPSVFRKQRQVTYLQKMMGQILLYPVNVSGWKGDRYWIDSNSLMFRLKLPSVLLNNANISLNSKGEFEDDFSDFYNQKNQNFKVSDQARTYFETHYSNITKKELKVVLLLPKLDQDTKEMLKIYQNQNAYQYCIQLMSIPEYQLC